MKDKVKQETNKWIDALDFKGNYSIEECFEVFKGRKTKEGSPALCFVVSSPEEAVMAVVFGVSLYNLLAVSKSLFEGQLGDQLWGQLEGQLSKQLDSQLSDQLNDQLWEQLLDELAGQIIGQLGDQLWGQLWSQLRDQLRGQPAGQLRDQLGDQLGSQLGGQLWSQLWDQLSGQLGGQLEGQLRDRLWGQLGSQLGSQLEGQLGQAHKCIWDYYLMAFYESANKVAGIDEPFTSQSLLPAFQKGLGYLINMNSVQVGVMRPEAYIDQDRRIHKEDGPAIIWGSQKRWFWRGAEVEQDWIENKTSVDPSLGLTHENMEKRRALCEILGWAKVLEGVDHKVIDEDDPEIGALIEVDLPNLGKTRFLKVRCGTGRDFALCVPNDMKTALQANSWTYGLEPEDFKVEVRT